jgi:autotransporter-associated beta strand protein
VNALPPTAVVTLDGENGGNGTQWADLDLAGFDQALAGLTTVARSGRLQRVYNSGTAATLTLSNSADYAFGGSLGKASGNDFGLTKGGTGTFTLSGTNHTYNGPTTVNGGTLLVRGLAGTGVITVNQGGSLGGTGTLGADSLTVNSGGVLSAGVGTNAGSLRLGRAALMWLKPASTFVVHLNGSTPGTYDQILPQGDILLEQPTLQVVLGYTPMVGDQHTIIDSEAGFLDGTFAGIPNAGTVTFGGYDFRVDYGGFDGNAVVLTCIGGGVTPPTPPTLAGGGPLTGTSFPLSFSGPAGQTYQVLVSTNLTLPLTNWAVLSTGTFGAGPAAYTDTTATNQQRFYIIKSP